MSNVFLVSDDPNKNDMPLLLFCVIYIGLAVTYIISPGLIQQFSPIHKAIPILLLSIWMFASKSNRKKLLGFGLLLSAAGDAALDIHSMGFIWGIAFFASAHIVYTVCFLKSFEYASLRVIPSILLVIYTGFIIYMIFSAGMISDRVLLFSVLLYALIIIVMSISAVFFRKGSLLLIIGAFLFIASDSLIVWNKFIYPINLSIDIVMISYYLAQLFIACGFRYH